MKLKIKIGIDILMTALLLLLMAYQVTGQRLHEWFGIGMLVLFAAHTFFNIRWYGSLFKGKYTTFRVLQTFINIAVLVSILCLGFSGIVMSRHVFAFLPVNGPMATARTMHLAASYWGFVLMSVHLGLHWNMMIGMFQKLSGREDVPFIRVWLIRIMAGMIALYGTYCFVKADIISYMFLKAQFAFFDFEQGAASVFSEYIAMMGFWVFASYYAAKGIRKISLSKSHREEKKGGAP